VVLDWGKEIPYQEGQKKDQLENHPL